MEDEFEGDAEYPAPLLEPVQDVDDGDVTELFAAAASIGASPNPSSQTPKKTPSQAQRQLFADDALNDERQPSDDDDEAGATTSHRKRSAEEAEEPIDSNEEAQAPPARRQKP